MTARGHLFNHHYYFHNHTSEVCGKRYEESHMNQMFNALITLMLS